MEIVGARWALLGDDLGLIPEAGIAVEGAKILGAGALADLKIKFPDAPLTYFSQHLLIPGLINAHCHLDRLGFYESFSVDTQGGAPSQGGLSPVNWLLEGLRYLSRTPSQNLAADISRALESMTSLGITSVGAMTHYEGTYPILKASGIRGVVFPEIISGPDKQAQNRFEVALALIEQYNDPTNDRAKMGFGPYAPYLLSRNLLGIIAKHARDSGLPLVIHAAESISEMEFFFDSQGAIATQLFPAIGWEELPPPYRKTPIQYLNDIGFFSLPTTIVGGIHLSSGDYLHLKQNGVRVIACPSAIKKLGLGEFPWEKHASHDISVGLGTEVLSDRDGFNLWYEMYLALQSSPSLNPLRVLKMATVGGAKALGLWPHVGALTEGRAADYVVTGPCRIDEASPEASLRKWMEEMAAGQIACVSVAGRILHGK